MELIALAMCAVVADMQTVQAGYLPESTRREFEPYVAYDQYSGPMMVSAGGDPLAVLTATTDATAKVGAMDAKERLDAMTSCDVRYKYLAM
ncbi:hypothetical protein SAMN05444339_10282 [Loktanella atrilutea]|uniref:Uncharacterized protein n=1 Tax=Loktanella atrilutea TaxID=366533 RepID=A0A1M4WDZ0_LOKAT|nr:hypothetical protein [Loktanella atrilutea]SHE79434.1 hypothetical protein SAMN05444339_10282 [Loktanella atrilutea]